MSRFQIIEAKPYHCGQIVRRLRAEHQTAISGLGIRAHQNIRECFDDSAYRRAAMVEGRLLGLFGVTGSAVASTGLIWLALSEESQQYPVAVVLECRRQMDAIMSVKHEIYTTLIPEDRTALRFATKMGFEVSHNSPIEIGSGRVIAVRYRRKSVAEAA